MSKERNLFIERAVKYAQDWLFICNMAAQDVSRPRQKAVYILRGGKPLPSFVVKVNLKLT